MTQPTQPIIVSGDSKHGFESQLITLIEAHALHSTALHTVSYLYPCHCDVSVIKMQTYAHLIMDRDQTILALNARLFCVGTIARPALTIVDTNVGILATVAL